MDELEQIKTRKGIQHEFQIRHRMMKGLLLRLMVVFASLLGTVLLAAAAPVPMEPIASVRPGDVDGKSYDLVVIGSTPGGIACAVRAAREGLTVLLVNHTRHLGGFITSGAGGWEAPYDGLR